MIHPIRERKRGRACGPKPSFTQSDAARFLWVLRSECGERARKRKSRGAVAKALGLGEGSVRTLTSFLRGERLVEVKRRGIALTPKGAQALAALGVRDARFVPATELSYGKKAFAVVVSEKGAAGVTGIFWRDAAVREGADGATMLFFKNGGLELPFGNYEVRFADAEKIKRALSNSGVEDGDAVVLGFSATPLAGERGAWAAAMKL